MGATAISAAQMKLHLAIFVGLSRAVQAGGIMLLLLIIIGVHSLAILFFRNARIGNTLHHAAITASLLVRAVSVVGVRIVLMSAIR